MTTVDKSALFANRLPEDDVEVPGIGTMRVRSLSRAEAFTIHKHQGTEKGEVLTLFYGIVDPKLTEAEVGRWLKASPPKESDPVVTRILELSGLLDDSFKKAVKTFVEEPEAEFPVLPGGESGQDGGRIGRDES